MKKPVQSELLPRKHLLAASVALAALCTAASGAHAATIGPNFCLAGSNASLCNMQIDLRSGGDDEEDDHPSAITYQSAGYVGVSMAISSTGAGANARQNLSFTLTGRQAEGRQWGFTDLWINLVPGALAGILPNLKSISQSTVAKDGSTTNGTVSFTNGFSFQKKNSSATGSNYYGVLKNADNKDVGPWGTFNFGLQAKGEDNPLVQAQITLSWDLDGPILNDLLTQPVMALNGTNAGAPGGAGGQSAAATLFAWDLLSPARSSYDDSEHDDDHDEHESDDMLRFTGAWPAGPDQNQTPNPVPLPLSAVLLLSAFPVLALRRKLTAA